MLSLEMPWFELVIRAAVIYFFLLIALREHECEEISDVKLAVLEISGNITVIAKK